MAKVRSLLASTDKRRNSYLVSLLLTSVLIYASWSGSLRRGVFVKASTSILVNVDIHTPIAAVYMTGHV